MSNCPVCKSPKSDVIDSRPISDIRMRRRKCDGCAETFTTYELPRAEYLRLRRADTLMRHKTALARFRETMALMIRAAEDLDKKIGGGLQ